MSTLSTTRLNENRSKLPLVIGGTMILLVLAGGLVLLQPHTFHGTLLQSPDQAYDFTLQVVDGETVHLSDYRGKLVLVYFGYTFCPDVCPATLGTVAQALNQLGQKADEVQVIMISVDPGRDSPEKLAEYVSHFNPSFVGGTNSPEEIAKITSRYGIYYKISSEATSNGDYLVDHTATLMVIDRGGHLKLVLPFGVTANEIADDLKYLLK